MLAKNDFKNASITAAFQHSIKAIQWLIRIGKHLGSFKERAVTGVKWAKNNSEFGLPNEKGEYLYVPREYFEIYVECPTKLLSDVTSVIEKERELIIGYNNDGKIDECHYYSTRKAHFQF